MARPSLRFGTLMAAALSVATPAASQSLTFTNASGATATFYGQVNLTFQTVDDGVGRYDAWVDNANSTSRLGVNIDAPLGDGGKFRFNFETALGLESTNDTCQTCDPPWIDWQRTDIRKLEGIFSGSYGKVYVGQGSMATDGVAEIDDSGTSVAGYVNRADMNGSFSFRDDAGDLTGPRMKDVFKDLDGGRRFRLRYDTPGVSGFSVAAAYGQDILAEDDTADYYDAAVRYGMDNDAVRFSAAMGYQWKVDEGSTTEDLIASGSLMHKPTGINVTAAAGDRQTEDGQYYYVKLGWVGDIIDAGSTAVSIDHYEGTGFGGAGSVSDSWGVQAVQKIDAFNLEVYAGYTVQSYKEDGAPNYQDIGTLLVGGRYRF